MAILADVEQVEALPDRVLGLSLRLRAPAPAMAPGQYVCVGAPGDARLPLSLASDPADFPALTLHFQPTPGHSDSAYLLDLLERGGPLEVALPFGDCCFETPLAQPLLMLAGGTGITQLRSVLLAQLRLGADQADAPPLRLYWGALHADGLYLWNELDLLAEAYPRFSWVACAEQGAESRLGCVAGRVGDAVLKDISVGKLTLKDWQVLLGGGPGMVWGTVEALLPAGLRRRQCAADAFAYAPRSLPWPDAEASNA
ncbi:MAG: hypothetical protein O2811_03055 [Proteobacteria bacterium]|nr:hypothetical protein [Pseudomonadota bacterium]